jgi:hypothetical protein
MPGSRKTPEGALLRSAQTGFLSSISGWSKFDSSLGNNDMGKIRVLGRSVPVFFPCLENNDVPGGHDPVFLFGGHDPFSGNDD